MSMTERSSIGGERSTGGTCAICGNFYDKAFTVTLADGASSMFDSIECAAMWLAPTCATCSTNVLGHGVESDGTIYCCANCAEQAGEHGLTDRKDHDAASLLCDFSMGRVIEAHDVQGRTLALRKPPSSVRRISTRPPVTQVWYAGWSTDAGPATTRPSTRSNRLPCHGYSMQPEATDPCASGPPRCVQRFSRTRTPSRAATAT